MMNSADTPSPTAQGLEPEKEIVQNIDFQNTQIAFRYKSDAELQKAQLLFNSVRSSLLVKLGPSLVNMALRMRMPIRGLLKYYFYDQFCGGKNLEDTLNTIEKLGSYGVSVILDYGVEASKTEHGFETTKQEIIETLQFAHKSERIPFVAMKLTGIGSFDILEKAQKNQLSEFDQLQFDKIRERFEAICSVAFEYNQPLLVDAEESWIQDIIDRLTEEMMFQFNRNQPIIYTTVQMYRSDRLEYVKELFLAARRRQSIPGVKLVRGAYLEKENRRSMVMNYPTPMQLTKRNTDVAFNTAAHYILERLDKYALLAGTHNEESCLLIADYIRKNDMPTDHPMLHFSQLYGMSDHISFNLADAGFNVGKYLPFGPLEAVLPYLFRRAQENSSIAGQTGRELILIEKELQRRRDERRYKLPISNLSSSSTYAASHSR